jgi:hypothetical protein
MGFREGVAPSRARRRSDKGGEPQFASGGQRRLNGGDYNQ